MRKHTLALAFMTLAVCLALGALLPCVSSAAGNDKQELTGEVWQASTINEKLAFLYGVSCAVAVEKELAGNKGDAPSIFVENWLRAFKDQTPTTISRRLDDWLAAHPNNRNRHVFDVLWYEFIVPGNVSKTGVQP